MARTPLQPIAVFADLENIGTNHSDTDVVIRRLARIFTSVPRALKRHGFRVEQYRAVASAKGRRKEPIGKHRRQRINGVLFDAGCSMRWVETEADPALIRDIENEHAWRILPHTVLILTGDKDFIPIVEYLRTQGHFVIVSGPNMSRRLAQAANQRLLFRELVQPP